MWRWVTRGLVLTFLSLLTAAALAQQPEFISKLELPDPAQTHSGVVLVKGWVLDRQQVSKIELYVDGQFQHKIQNMGIPRIDVTEAYPNWPGVQNSSPGFQSGFLASRFSTGLHTVTVKVFASDGRVYDLEPRNINIDNTQNQAPFGFIDIPDPKGIYNAAGSFPVSGWAVDADGIMRIEVQIDDLNMQGAVYGDVRPDVGNTFPDLPDALFSGFIANVDTTRVEDGVHLLTVRGVDNKGMSRMIGRRTIQVFNSENNLKPFGYIDEPKRDAVLYGTLCATIPPGGGVSPNLPVNPNSHITPVRGWALDLSTRTDVGRVAYVELEIDGSRVASTDNCGYSAVFGTYVNCYGYSRPDVARYYPNYPDVPRAGFMFNMDVGALMAIGYRPGNHQIKVRVGDYQQTFAEIPNRDGIPVWFTCAEETFDFPTVGSIDFPSNYDYVKGMVTFQGWAYDENDGVLAVTMFVDGNPLGVAQLGFPRPDVPIVYPYLRNASNTGWKFTFDTSRLSNSRHQLTVVVNDRKGNKPVEIGSAYFYVANPQP